MLNSHSIFSGLYWVDDEPGFSIINEDGIEVGYAISSGQYISMSLGKERYCTGYYDDTLAKRTACKNSSKTSNIGPVQCFYCKQKDRAFAAKTGIANTWYDSELLASKHVVYLALFGENPIPKIGVTRYDRFSNRIHEQGAWAAATILSSDGNSARRVERELHHSFGFPEAVRLDSKLSQICDILDEKVAEKILLTVVDNINKRHIKNIDVRVNQFIYSYRDFGIRQTNVGNTIKLVTSFDLNFEMTGEIVGIVGKVILISSNHETYAINTKLLEGYVTTNLLITDIPSLRGALSTFQVKVININKQARLF